MEYNFNSFQQSAQRFTSIAGDFTVQEQMCRPFKHISDTAVSFLCLRGL